MCGYLKLLNSIFQTLQVLKSFSINCSLSASDGHSTLKQLWEYHGQSPWYDNLRRPIDFLHEYIDFGVRGVTSNPTVR